MKRSTIVRIAALLPWCIFPLFSGEREMPTIAISDLIGQGVDQTQAIVVTDQLRVELLKSKKLRIFERNQMEDILREQGFQQTGCTNDACAVEIGQLLGVSNILVGTLGVAGSYTVMTIRILDVKTGAIVSSETVQTRGGIDRVLETGIRDISQRILAGFFDEKPVAQPTQQERSPASGKKTAVLWGSIGAVVVGGGVAAIVLLNDKNDEPLNEHNVEISLP